MRALGAMKKILNFAYIFGCLVLVVWVLNRDAPSTFALEFHGMEELKIQTAVVHFNDSSKSFDLTNANWGALSGFRLEVNPPTETGNIDLELTQLNDSKLHLSGIEYKVGKTNYVSVHNGELSYVKAHWN